MVGPSSPVLSNMPDLFHDDQQDLPGSPLLRISDCIPLSVQVHGNVQETQDQQNLPYHHHHQQQQQHGIVTTLAISRLGGYIELVPLTTQMWAGPLLTTDNFRLPKPKRKRQHPQQQQQHYALGRNIACPLSTIALTTCEYHTDIQALEVFRTNVSSETIWNDQDFPNISRANLIQSYVGDIDCVIRLCELGLKCLTSKGTFDDAALPIGQDHKVWQSAVSLQGMILDDVVSMDDDGIDIPIFKHWKCFVPMSLVKLFGTTKIFPTFLEPI
jgi:hypothetical protein